MDRHSKGETEAGRDRIIRTETDKNKNGLPETDNEDCVSSSCHLNALPVLCFHRFFRVVQKHVFYNVF